LIPAGGAGLHSSQQRSGKQAGIVPAIRNLIRSSRINSDLRSKVPRSAKRPQTRRQVVRWTQWHKVCDVKDRNRQDVHKHGKTGYFPKKDIKHPGPGGKPPEK